MDIGKVISNSNLLKQTNQNITNSTVQEESNQIIKTESIEINAREIKKEEARQIVEGLNNFSGPTNTALRFEFHEKLEEYFVTIVDSKTDELVKEIPPKRLLDIYAAMAEQLGFIVDHKI